MQGSGSWSPTVPVTDSEMPTESALEYESRLESAPELALECESESSTVLGSVPGL